ncbi:MULTISPECIES: hypothetical protein [unclassified Coleofasciculus]|uniref:hypothetical protein n=1 Tax=Cyanophyceae TaxID=3028117 RepID=UPI0016889FDD|nr:MULTISPECIES: hypothetical protein [unclassified Coleofasciculus]MBD1840563.1 hypothetical protein [Coleofasciculus sp. FACHB-501]
MFRYFRLTVTVSTALSSLFPGIALSLPLQPDSPYPVVPASNIDIPVCYLQTEDGRRVDLGKLCIQAPENSNAPLSSNFGAGNCYFVDSTGKPCRASSASNPQQ